MRTIAAGYAAAIGQLRQAVASGDQARIDTAMAGDQVTREVSAGVVGHVLPP